MNKNRPEKVYFFGTCLIDMSYPEAGMAGIRLIQREGVKVIFPPDQSCCGQPAYNSGFPEEAKAVARKQIEIFNKDYPIVVPSGSCAGMMKHHYPKLFENDPDIKRVRAFSSRIYELTEFLVHVLKIKLADKGEPVTAAWHSSCHAAREMKVIEDSKSLIRQLKNVRLKELENEHQCCGFGGTFSIKHPDISSAMVKDKIEDIKNTGASIVLSGDCGCLMNITGAMDYHKISIKGQHIAQFIWERINGE
ncbi:Putative lactate utilization protein A, LutA [Desulfonema limicola]|uniref:Lactate utilization protein A, LutA n=1 Tax=Desulfonema limicola TaxID=45656 RepID=A0A975BAU5_9BACT|nr:(Fe-S)-binding protein [Desulfonema limicola]QTA82126.1 Putative lactate utilization protein A, LutA [Desulfonema limicola]